MGIKLDQLLEALALDEDIESTNDGLFFKAYDARPELMDNILHDMGYSEDDFPTLDDIPLEDRQKAFSLWLDEVRERAKWQDDMDSAVYEIIDLVDSSNLGESLNESLYIIVPVEKRYDDLTFTDYEKFFLKYGAYKTREECWDKIEELAPDRWDAFIPMKLEGVNESLYEDFWNPGKEFNDFIKLLQNEFDDSGWNSWSQEERDNFAKKVAKRYLEVNPTPTPVFFQDLTDNNYHIERRAFERLL